MAVRLIYSTRSSKPKLIIVSSLFVTGHRLELSKTLDVDGCFFSSFSINSIIPLSMFVFISIQMSSVQTFL